MGQGIGYKDSDGSFGFKLTDDGKVILGNTSDDVIQVTGTLSVSGTLFAGTESPEQYHQLTGRVLVDAAGTNNSELIIDGPNPNFVILNRSGTQTGKLATDGFRFTTYGSTSMVSQAYADGGVGKIDFCNLNAQVTSGTKHKVNITASTDALRIDTDSGTEVFKVSGDTSHVTKLSLGGTTITATGTELNYIDGVTSAIQTQIDSKQATIDSSNRLNANLIGANGNVSNEAFGYLQGVDSNIQTQIETKAPTASPTFTGNATFDTDTLFVDSSNNRVGIGTTTPGANLAIEGDHDGGTVSLRLGADSSSASNFSARMEFAEDVDVSRVMTHGAYFDYDGDASSPDLGMLKIGMRDNSTSDTDVVKISRKAEAGTLILGDDSLTQHVSGEMYLTSSGGSIHLTAPGNDINLNGIVVIGASHSFNVASTAAFTGTTNMSSLGIGTASPQIPLDIYNGSSLISQTIIDGKSTTFSCETSSTTYKQINDDTSSDKIASITFTVPASRKVLVTMRAPVRDFDSSSQLFRVRVTDSNSESTEGSWGSDFNDEQLSGHYATDFFVHTFQWYFDGSAAPHNWSSGDSKTMYFQLKVDGSSETVSIKAGNGFAPMVITAESVPNNVSHVDMG